ncbi:cyclodeaminase [Aliiroseovarius sp. PTFE2010]|uniref:cyclodeaminase n=1 Tax=Aliiroseovarius sp. PTFE2010 TaxID=3417190 RepID=UPI003CF1BAE9
MSQIRILTEAELRAAVPLDLEAVCVVEDGFRALAEKQVVMPPVLSMAIKDFNGEVDVKTAYVPGLDSFAIKVSPGFFDNPKIGLPSTSGLMILFAARTGQIEALLLDNGYLTDVRTAAAGAVAARHLARKDASRATVIGTGMQARLQLAALCLVRPITSAVIWGRNRDAAQALASVVAQDLSIDVSVATDPESAVANADVIVTTTPSTEPLVMGEWLSPGQHVTAMGSDQHDKSELAPSCIARADLYVPDRLSQTRTLGELRAAIDAGVIGKDTRFDELGEIIAGAAPGRVSHDQITIADLTGTGVQDTAIATFAHARATNAALGTNFES